MKLAVFGDPIVMLHGGGRRRGGWMNLQRRLGCQQHARTPPDRHVVLQAIARKHSGPGAHQDDVCGAVNVEGASDPQRWLRVSVGQHRASVAALERQLEPGVAAHIWKIGSASHCIHSAAVGKRFPTPFQILVEQVAPNPRDHIHEARTALQVREEKRPVASHQLRVAGHDVEVRADVGREIDLVDHEQVGARDARSALARNLVAARDVDDVDRRIDQLRAEARRQVVPPLSRKTRSRSGWRSPSSSMASKFIEASSRIAVCGQPPVCTPMIRSEGSAWLRTRNSMSSRVKMSLVMTPSRY